MKKFLVGFLLFTLAAAPAVLAAEAEWLTDLPTALRKAEAEHKTVMMDFTGSDWCGWCKKLKAEVFDQPEFIAYANANLVLVEVDFPRSKSISAEQKAANKELARTYSIQGYPTIIFVDSHSTKVGEAGYMAGGPKAFIAHIEHFAGSKHSIAVAKADEPEAPRHAPPAFVPVVPVKPNYYSELALKAVSGAPGRRMALINNASLMTGESAKVRVRDTRIDVVCKEIREDSVLITVDGQPMELQLGQKGQLPPAAPAAKPAPAVAPAPQPRQYSYAGLTLKEITEVKGGRMARINGLSFVIGGTRSIKANDKTVEVICKEINKDSVLITVDGKLVELKLIARSPGAEKVAQN